jgi:hypothetical protein
MLLQIESFCPYSTMSEDTRKDGAAHVSSQDYRMEHVRLVREAGFRAAVSTVRSIAPQGQRLLYAAERAQSRTSAGAGWLRKAVGLALSP